MCRNQVFLQITQDLNKILKISNAALTLLLRVKVLFLPKNAEFLQIFTALSLCITASGNISLKLFKALLETIVLLIFWYVVAEHHIVQL